MFAMLVQVMFIFHRIFLAEILLSKFTPVHLPAYLLTCTGVFIFKLTRQSSSKTFPFLQSTVLFGVCQTHGFRP